MELHQYKDDALLEELSSRCSSFVWGSHKERNGGSYIIHHNGDELICLGLADKIKDLINSDEEEPYQKLKVRNRF